MWKKNEKKKPRTITIAVSMNETAKKILQTFCVGDPTMCQVWRWPDKVNYQSWGVEGFVWIRRKSGKKKEKEKKKNRKKNQNDYNSCFDERNS